MGKGEKKPPPARTQGSGIEGKKATPSAKKPQQQKKKKKKNA